MTQQATHCKALASYSTTIGKWHTKVHLVCRVDITVAQTQDMKLREKYMQHQGLQEALLEYEYKFMVMPVNLGFSESHFQYTPYTLKQLGIGHSPAATFLIKLPEHAVTIFTQYSCVF